MTDTVNNSIPLVPENTTDPAAGLNLAIDTIDALLQLAVLGIETAPPSGSVDGDRYIVDTGATGDWAGQDGKIARYVATGDYWQFNDARLALNLNDSKIYIYDGAWQEHVDDPAQTKNTDVFVVYGQSNAAGGTAITSGDPVAVPLGRGYKWDFANNNGGGLQHLEDPTRKDGQQNISAWPAFGLSWTLLSKRPAVIVNMAVGGKTALQLSPVADGGTAPHFQDMIDATQDTIDALVADGFSINSLNMIWVQGESDASAGTNLTDYENQLTNIADAFFAEFDSQVANTPNLYISKIWGNTNNTTESYWKNVEQLGYIQVNKTSDHERWSCVFDKAPLFTVNNGYMGPDDSVHYSQAGYDLMGSEMARNIYAETRLKGIVKNEMIVRNQNMSVATVRNKSVAHDLAEPDLPCLIHLEQATLGRPPAFLEDDILKLVLGALTDKSRSKKVYLDAVTEEPKIDGALEVRDPQNNVRLQIDPLDGSFSLYTADGNIEIRASSTAFLVITGAGNALQINNDGTVKFKSLQDGSAGLTSGAVYYDSTDGNTVKYVP